MKQDENGQYIIPFKHKHTYQHIINRKRRSWYAVASSGFPIDGQIDYATKYGIKKWFEQFCLGTVGGYLSYPLLYPILAKKIVTPYYYSALLCMGLLSGTMITINNSLFNNLIKSKFGHICDIKFMEMVTDIATIGATTVLTQGLIYPFIKLNFKNSLFLLGIFSAQWFVTKQTINFLDRPLNDQHKMPCYF